MIKLHKDIFLDMVVFVIIVAGIGFLFSDWLCYKIGLQLTSTVYLIAIPIVVITSTPILIYLYYEGREYRVKRPLWQIIIHILNVATVIVGALIYLLKHRSLLILIALFICCNIFFVLAVYCYDRLNQKIKN